MLKTYFRYFRDVLPVYICEMPCFYVKTDVF